MRFKGKTAWTYLQRLLTDRELKIPGKFRQQVISTHLSSYTVSLPEYRNLNFYRLKNFGRFMDKYAAQHSFLKTTQHTFFPKGCGERISQPRKQIKLLFLDSHFALNAGGRKGDGSDRECVLNSFFNMISISRWVSRMVCNVAIFRID